MIHPNEIGGRCHSSSLGAACYGPPFLCSRYHEAMSARTLLTFEQFEQFHDDGLKHELLGGEHIVLPPPKRRHTKVQQNISDALRPYVKQRRLGEVYIEAGFKLSDDTWLQPDVSFLRTSQIESGDPNGYFEGAPALAIEVASESNTAAQLDMKMEQYFAHGAEEVWVAYPETRENSHPPSRRPQPDRQRRARIRSVPRLVGAGQRDFCGVDVFPRSKKNTRLGPSSGTSTRRFP